jgi:hypothetical protein
MCKSELRGTELALYSTEVVRGSRVELPARRAVAIALTFFVLCCGGLRAEESQATKQAFQSYIDSLEKRLETQNASNDHFLWIDQNPRRRDSVRKGAIEVERVDTPQIPGGTLEHWIGGEFIPGVTLADVIKADQNYVKYPAYYAPEILQARVLSRDKNHFKVFYRLKKHEIVTVVLDTTHDVDFISLGSDKYFVRSRSEDIREVSRYGSSDEKDLPENQGTGFLWSMNSYWRMEQRDGGVYLECDVVTLGRSIPLGIGGLVRSVIDSLARESFTNTLVNKRRAVLAQK